MEHDKLGRFVKQDMCVRGHSRTLANVNGSGGCKICHVHAERRSWKRRLGDKKWRIQRNSNLKRLYGLTLTDYEALLVAQNYKCANLACQTIDGKSPRYNRGTLAVDHDHACCFGPKSCGKCIRGLLCSPCNGALGHMRDSKYQMQGLIAYLENNLSTNTRQVISA